MKFLKTYIFKNTKNFWKIKNTKHFFQCFKSTRVKPIFPIFVASTPKMSNLSPFFNAAPLHPIPSHPLPLSFSSPPPAFMLLLQPCCCKYLQTFKMFARLAKRLEGLGCLYFPFCAPKGHPVVWSSLFCVPKSAPLFKKCLKVSQ